VLLTRLLARLAGALLARRDDHRAPAAPPAPPPFPHGTPTSQVAEQAAPGPPAHEGPEPSDLSDYRAPIGSGHAPTTTPAREATPHPPARPADRASAPPATGQPGGARRHTLKIVVAGEGNVGKTSLIRRYAAAKFSETRQRTLGIDITTQEVVVAGRSLRLALWDIEGQAGERPFFYYGAQAALLVYDATEPRSLEALGVWMERVRRHAPPGTPLLIAGNKADLPVAVPEEWGRDLAGRAGAAGHLQLSARTGQNVAHTFAWLAELALAGAAEPVAEGAAPVGANRPRVFP
jgi:small GTP-binding protein